MNMNRETMRVFPIKKWRMTTTRKYVTLQFAKSNWALSRPEDANLRVLQQSRLKRRRRQFVT